MRVCDSFTYNGTVFAACAGSGISRDMKINRIRVNGTEYRVKHTEVREAFIGVLQAMFEIDGSQPVPKGEVTVLA